MQGAGDLGRTRPAGPGIGQIGHGVVGDHVHQRVFAFQQFHDAFNLFVAVVHALDQRPLVLDWIARGAGIDLARLDQVLWGKPWGLGQQLRTQIGPGAVQ